MSTAKFLLAVLLSKLIHKHREALQGTWSFNSSLATILIHSSRALSARPVRYSADGSFFFSKSHNHRLPGLSTSALVSAGPCWEDPWGRLCCTGLGKTLN